MISKEDILNKRSWSSEYPNYMAESNILDAMDEYSKEIAIDFFKWYAIKMANLLYYIKDIRPIVESQELEEKIKEHEGKSIEELYQEYLSYLNTLKQ